MSQSNMQQGLREQCPCIKVGSLGMVRRQSGFTGYIYRLDPDLTCHCMVEGIGLSNGRAFSRDSRTMYFADSQGGYVWAWDFDPVTGDIDGHRVFIDFRDTGGCADGAKVDAEGCYWTTLPESGKLSRYDPDGRLMRTIMIPTSIPTCCEFWGRDLDVLYVTSAKLRKLTDPLAGALFALDVGVNLTLPYFKEERGGAVDARTTRRGSSGTTMSETGSQATARSSISAAISPIRVTGMSTVVSGGAV
jgi:hypothetical protein